MDLMADWRGRDPEFRRHATPWAPARIGRHVCDAIGV